MTTYAVGYLNWLEAECGYKAVRLLPDGRWAALSRMLYTTAIITGRVGDTVSFDDRWCYHTADAPRPPWTPGMALVSPLAGTVTLRPGAGWRKMGQSTSIPNLQRHRTLPAGQPCRVGALL
jgi:hypothetical protein